MLYIVATIQPLEDFNPDSLKPEMPEDGIQVVTGELETGEAAIQCIKFDPANFDQPAAEKWLMDKGITAQSIEEEEVEEPVEEPAEDMAEERDEEDKPEMPAEEMAEEDELPAPEKKDEEEDEEEEDMKKSYDLADVEIMRCGTWNDTTFTTADLDDMVEAFQATRTDLKPYLKLGHDDNQSLLQSDGLPAAGWITELKRSGDKLLAKIRNIPEKVYSLIENKRYGRFSAEVYFDAFINDKPFRRALKAVALLGADTPAVSTMDDLIGLYKRKDVTFSRVVNITGGDMPEEKKFAELQKENDSLKSEVDAIKKDRRQDKVNAFIESAVNSGKILPSQVELYSALMMDESVKTFSVKQNDKSIEKKGTSFDIVAQIIESSKPQVDFSERSQNHKPENMSEADELDQKIKAYAKENSVSYSVAYDQVIREK